MKEFSYPLKEFKSTTTRMKAAANITKKTPSGKEEKWKTYWSVPDSVIAAITSMDDFKKVVLSDENREALPDDCFFIDHNGNYAFHENNDDWMRYNGMMSLDTPEGFVEVPSIRQNYCYFDKTEKVIFGIEAYFTVEVDINNAVFTVDEDWNPSVMYKQERASNIYLYDYNLGCNEPSSDYITQNVFNKDDKFEFIVDSYREVAAPTNIDSLFNNGLSVENIKDGKLIITKLVQDKYYESYAKVVNEDGTKLFTLPATSDRDMVIHRLNGKTYLSCYTYSPNEDSYYVLYLLDETGTGITELARTKAVKGAPKFFNTQGVQVNKDAKGIVIQQGGAKYLNK